jgi:membrane associated rhomboid family serine protease
MINENNPDSNSLSRNEINISHNNQINESQEIPMIRNLNIPTSNTKIFKNFNFAFSFIFLINLILYIGSLLKFENSDFSICQWPIYFKHQYYRIITHNFFHLGLLHITFNMVFFFSITKDLEKKIDFGPLSFFNFPNFLKFIL